MHSGQTCYTSYHWDSLAMETILMGETIPEESGCMVEEVTSSCDSDESDLET